MALAVDHHLFVGEGAVDPGCAQHRLELVTHHGVVSGIDRFTQRRQRVEQVFPVPVGLGVERRDRAVRRGLDVLGVVVEAFVETLTGPSADDLDLDVLVGAQT